MRFKPSLSLANFTCRFGPRLVLLDLFWEIIYPAFFESSPREFSKNVLYLFDLQFKNIGSEDNPEPIIAGRFVRDLELTRSHILRDNTLVPNDGELESATAAQFVLYLSTHTLLYVPVTPHAPPIGMFRSTMQYHLTNAWRAYIKKEARQRRKINKTGPTIREIFLNLIKQIPRPELTLVELPSEISISDFIKKFEKIDRVEYRIHDTNHSVDFMPLVNQLRAEKDATESTEIIVIENKPQNRKALTNQLGSALSAGNVDAKVVGKSQDGEKISGTNENFRLSVPLVSVPRQVSKFVNAMNEKLKELIDRKLVKIPSTNKKQKEKVMEITYQREKADE